jgi:hypothetical protein
MVLFEYEGKWFVASEAVGGPGAILLKSEAWLIFAPTK